MKTLRLSALDLDTPAAQADLDRAAQLLASGALVALPTETVYGLGANALDPKAVAAIFAAKNRPGWDPVIVHIATLDQLAPLVDHIPEAAQKLIDAFWPGPLTLLLPRSTAISDAVTSGRPLVGIRMPAHPVALELIRRSGVPVAAPSANLFSHTSPTTASHVLDDLDTRIDAILDAGPCLHGVESTVLDPTQNPMVLYRPGAITAAQIEAATGIPVTLFRPPVLDTPPEALPSPGVGIRHYAPRARVHLIQIDPATPAASQPALLDQLLRQKLADLTIREAVPTSAKNLPSRDLVAGSISPQETKIGIMLPTECQPPSGAAAVFPWGAWSRPAELASNLYSGLRSLDDAQVDHILCPLPPESEIGLAIADRLRKAAKH